jgi:hypothetical protein
LVLFWRVVLSDHAKNLKPVNDKLVTFVVMEMIPKGTFVDLYPKLKYFQIRPRCGVAFDPLI